MRINTANQFERSVETLQQRQQSLHAAQERITTGKRVLRPSDDPAAAARAERALAQQYRVDADRRGLDASKLPTQCAVKAFQNTTGGDLFDVTNFVGNNVLAVRDITIRGGTSPRASCRR